VYPNATAAILAANQFNDPPPAGSQFFMVAVSATYSGSGSSHLDPTSRFRAVGASNVAHTMFEDHNCGVMPSPNLELDNPQVFSGGTISGNAGCWTVTTADASSLVMFVHTDTDVWFALR
jgi:hypothetical protein